MTQSRACLFLDRDGVIIENVPYSRDPDQVTLRAGLGQLLQAARAQGMMLVCVTNQSGIGRGLLNFEDYRLITARMQELLLQSSGTSLDAIYFSPYFEKSKDPLCLQKPEWRKPGPGMFLQAKQDHNIDLHRSVMIGDRSSDLEAAFGVGIPKRYLIQSPDFPNEAKNIPAGIEFMYVQNYTQIVF